MMIQGTHSICIRNSGPYCRQNPGIPAYEIKANEDLHKHGLYVLAAIKKIIRNQISTT